MHRPSIVRSLVTGLVIATAAGCVSQSKFDEDLTLLRDELETARVELSRISARNSDLELTLADLISLRDQVESNESAQGEVLDRVERFERQRLTELSEALKAQAQRIERVSTDLDSLKNLPEMVTLTRLDQKISNMDGQVELNRRLSNSNRDSIEKMTRDLEDQEVEFARQMKLLSQYVKEQFVPLAEGLVSHLYDESRRMSQSAAELENIARQIDPLKFNHLLPGLQGGVDPGVLDKDD